MKKELVVVAMSGGVDSSMAAWFCELEGNYTVSSSSPSIAKGTIYKDRPGDSGKSRCRKKT
jgi:tRNA U34 2-thiouridine synthase MnmA/TrmU